MKPVARRIARFRERFAQAIDIGSTSRDMAQGLTVYSKNPNLNMVSGDGNTINNYNSIVNNVGHGAAHRASVRCPCVIPLHCS